MGFARFWLPLFPTECAKCGEIITEGVRRANDFKSPPENALCEGCYLGILATPDPTPTN